MVGITHVGTRSHIIFGVDDFSVAGHHDLVDIGEVVKVDVLGGIGPTQGG